MTPVVLVHGFLAPRVSMLPLRAAIRKSGRPAHTVSLPPLAVQDVRWLSQCLTREVERIRHRYGAERCDLVGISQGGLVGAWYVKRGAGATRVRHLVTVGAPLRGTWRALALTPLVGAVRGVWQMMPASPLRQELEAAPWPEGVQCTAIALEGDPIVPVAASVLPGMRHVVVPGGGLLGHQSLIVDTDIAAAVVAALNG